MSSENVRIDGFSPDDEDSSGRDSIYFSTIRSRHADHFFADMHKHNSQKEKKGVIRYPPYEDINPNRSGTYPNLLLNKLSFSKDLRSSSDKALLRLPVLKQEFHNVSFELSNSDVMAVMYTKESEMLSLLRVLCGVRDVRGKISGDILINGHRMSRDRLEKTIALVSSEDPISTMTIRQFLHVQASFNPPMSERYGGVVHLINKLMSDLGLIPVCDIICSRLNRSQWQRVKVAAQLIRDPTILVCTDILKEIDVHDQCFLIDYLREWAVKTNRIVVMAVSPISLQVLRMFSKTVILASGRVVYYGAPGSMQQYFESVGCPCPPYKNLCDYYVDLVTHDNLTSDASRESSVRIARLVNKWNQSAPPLRRTASGKFLLDLPTIGFLMKPLIVLSLFWFDFSNNRVSRILSLLFVFSLSTAVSLYLSDLPVTLPEAFLDRNALLELVIFYFPLVLGLLKLKNSRHRLKEFLKLSVFRTQCSSFLFSVLSVIGEIPSLLAYSLVFTLPITIFTGESQSNNSPHLLQSLSDFHRKSPNYPATFVSLSTSVFLNLSVTQLIANSFSSLSSELLSYFFFIFFWVTLYISSGFPLPVPSLLKHINPLHLPATSIFQFLFEESPSLHPPLHVNFTHPIQLYSCGRTFLNTSQVTKGPCQKINSTELLSYYGYTEKWSREKTIMKLIGGNLLIGYIASIVVLFLLTYFLLYFSRSKLIRNMSKQ